MTSMMINKEKNATMIMMMNMREMIRIIMIKISY